MARKPMVTRTITSTKVTLMCVNTVAQTIEDVEIILPRTYKDKKHILKTVKATWDNENLVVADVKSFEEHTQLYGMPEEDFVKLAQPIYKENN